MNNTTTNIEATDYTLTTGEKVYLIDGKTTAIYDGGLPDGYHVDDFFTCTGLFLGADADGVEPAFTAMPLWRVVASYQDNNGQWCGQGGEEALGNCNNKAYRSEAEAISAIEDDFMVTYGEADEFGYTHGVEQI